MSDFGAVLRQQLQAEANETSQIMVAWLVSAEVWRVAAAVHPDAPVCPELVVYPEGKVAA